MNRAPVQATNRDQGMAEFHEGKVESKQSRLLKVINKFAERKLKPTLVIAPSLPQTVNHFSYNSHTQQNGGSSNTTPGLPGRREQCP
jgi:hypothetical protein